jgi:hypothetical protein
MERSKIIKIIYPNENKTLGFFKKSRWDVMTKNCIYYVYDYATIRALIIIDELYFKKNGKK